VRESNKEGRKEGNTEVRKVDEVGREGNKGGGDGEEGKRKEIRKLEKWDKVGREGSDVGKKRIK